MARRPLHLLVFALFMASLTLWGVAKGESDPTLQPHVQTIDGSALDQEVPHEFVPFALPNSVTREGRVIATDAPFTHFMVRWETTLAGTQSIALEARASEDSTTWTDWGNVALNDDMQDEATPDLRWSTTVYAGVARFWQLRATFTPAEDGTLPVLRTIQVHTVDSRAPESPLAPSAEFSASAFSGQRPSFVSRAAWGGSQIDSRSVEAQFYPASHLVIHHTADSNSLRAGESNWGDRVRAEWAFHTYSRGWGDIGYNWLIDPNGIVYEGRKGSSDAGRDAVGFHDTANYGSMGVALIGSFGRNAQPPTPQAIGTLTYLLAWKAYQRGIDPLGTSVYYGCTRSGECRRTNPSGAVLNIAGHRQITGATACPGDLTMAQMNNLRANVASVMRGVTTPPPPPEVGTPTAPVDIAPPPPPSATALSTPTNTATPTRTSTPTVTPSPTMTPSPTVTPTPRPRTRIEGQTRWSTGPVVLTQDQVVPAGSSLVIDPGVEVVLAPQVDIFVEGELRAVGTTAAPVRFRGTNAAWGGINGAPGSVIAMDHAIVSGAGANGIAIASTNGQVTFTASQLTGNIGGFRLVDAALELRDSRVSSNSTAGATVDLRLGPTQPVTIANTTFDGTASRAGMSQVRIAVVPGSAGALSVSGNTFANGTGPLLELEAAAPARGSIQCNSFNGGAIGFKLNASTPSGDNFAIALEQNAFGGQTNLGVASTVGLSAPNNWWGHASGPNDVQRNPAGQGVRVGINVDFQPVLAAQPACTVR